MILLLGASGYIGSAFAAELNRRKLKFEAPPRKWVDYSDYTTLKHYLASLKPEFVINAAGYSGKPNVDTCETHKAETLMGNVLLPRDISHACASLRIPWGHVSSGCIYDGAGPFTEQDPPNFMSSTYAASKAVAERVIKDSNCYIWRLRIPFDEFDSSRNYLSKLQRYSLVYEATNSISHRGDFVSAALDLWEKRAPLGIYNMTNPGQITSRQVVMMIHTTLCLDREWEFFENDADFYRTAAIAPRSNCVLDVSKLLATGVKLRAVEDAILDSLRKWRWE